MTHADCTTECAIPCVVCERLFCFQCRTEVLADEPRGGIKSGVFACAEHRALHDRGDYRSVWELKKIAYERKQAALKEALDTWEALDLERLRHLRQRLQGRELAAHRRAAQGERAVSLIDFLKTSRPKDELRAALEVVREFKAHESDFEWSAVPFIAWTKLEQLEEYLDHLVNGTPLADDTKRELARADR